MHAVINADGRRAVVEYKFGVANRKTRAGSDVALPPSFSRALVPSRATHEHRCDSDLPPIQSASKSRATASRESARTPETRFL